MQNVVTKPLGMHECHCSVCMHQTLLQVITRSTKRTCQAAVVRRQGCAAGLSQLNVCARQTRANEGVSQPTCAHGTSRTQAPAGSRGALGQLLQQKGTLGKARVRLKPDRDGQATCQH